MNNNNNLIELIVKLTKQIQQLDETWIQLACLLYDLEAEERFDECLKAYLDYRNNATAYMITLPPRLGKEK